MSDGMSDASAVGRLADELHEAACRLRDAIVEAEAGHRGLCPDVLAIIGPVLGAAGYRVTPARPR